MCIFNVYISLCWTSIAYVSLTSIAYVFLECV